MPAGSISRPGTTAAAAPVGRGGRWAVPAAAALLALGVLAVYGRTFSVPLLFDDFSSIGGNPTLRHLDAAALSPPAGAGVGGRPLLNLSFALNYAFGGTAVAGYHAINILIHLLAAWTLFGVVRRTLARAPMAACGRGDSLDRLGTLSLSNALTPRFDGSAASFPAFLIAFLWAVHPVQTEAVTYLSQRAESLMGLFYLLTLYAFVRYADASEAAVVFVGGVTSPRAASGDDNPRGEVTPPTSQAVTSQPAIRAAAWATAAIAACAAGALTKEGIVTAPVLVLLYDRTFVSGSFAAAWRRHRSVLLALAVAAWVPVALLLPGLSHRGVGFGTAVSPWSYALGEAQALLHYAGLAFWPHPLAFDYGPARMTTLADAWPCAAAVLALLGATVFALRRWPVAGFFPAAFFLLLAPTSSFVPIVWQPIAESRLYLPLAAVCAGVVLAVLVLRRRWVVPLGAVVAVALAVAAARRNATYASPLELWRDTVAACPDNPRARNYYGDELAKVPGRLLQAVAQYDAALRLQPFFPEAHNNLGTALEKMPGRLADAVAEFQAAIRQRPDFAAAHYNLATTLERIPDRLPDAIAEYRTALRLDPDLAAAHYNLGTALERLPGGSIEAVPEYEAAIRLKPDFAAAHASLASALAAAGRGEAAVAEYRAALRLQPRDSATHFNFANALRDRPGALNEAIAEYEAALRLRPDYVEARNNLGTALGAAGRAAEAMAQFEAASKQAPDYIPARLNYAVALMKTGDRAGAAAQLDAVLRLAPDNAPARQLRAQLNATP